MASTAADTTQTAVSKKEDDTKSEEKDATMTPEHIIKYLMSKSKSNDALIKVLGSPDTKQWKARECGDGNINYIFIVEGCNGSVVVKQAPPFIRLVGPDWALKPNRLNFEVSYTQKVLQYSPQNAPKIYLVDNDAFLFVMEDLNISKMVVFRSQIAKATQYPNMGKHVGLMVANMLFKTRYAAIYNHKHFTKFFHLPSCDHLHSDLSLKAEDKWNGLHSFCMNNEMVSLTEQVIFEEPFFEAKLNRFSFENKEYKKLCPQMLETVQKMRSDVKVIRTVYNLRRKFRNLHQALVHGDLHTGSIMVNEDRTVAIDAEFSFYGPYFVDVGLFIGNMLLACFSQKLYANEGDNVASSQKEIPEYDHEDNFDIEEDDEVDQQDNVYLNDDDYMPIFDD